MQVGVWATLELVNRICVRHMSCLAWNRSGWMSRKHEFRRKCAADQNQWLFHLLAVSLFVSFVCHHHHHYTYSCITHHHHHHHHTYNIIIIIIIIIITIIHYRTSLSSSSSSSSYIRRHNTSSCACDRSISFETLSF